MSPGLLKRLRPVGQALLSLEVKNPRPYANDHCVWEKREHENYKHLEDL